MDYSIQKKVLIDALVKLLITTNFTFNTYCQVLQKFF